ncbi:serine/threonine-protein kinase [Amycolatopsis saalfeldensis]|uniref:non-specific serine/threonine protein kinase n=1 Tax=Amycolatopsis saalfeldensis TaxID=394193 RepID=A0A1H8VNM6_9PSEU|nr:serine/threonine-protein kinase [Amycolatopsis saalfeldensis]SEP16914.1 Serine/threonine protein kinase [Amycolatopsis saalfeldensis]
MTDEQTRPHDPTGPASGARVVAGRYRLLGELGRGGMGVVWRAQDQVIGRPVAIKELRLPDSEGSAVFSERVLREVRTGGRLNDPAVVTVFDVVTDGGTTWIVMELVEAPTLADLVRGQGPLPAAQAAAIGDRVLAALQAAHSAGIVHRDVKPANIMVAPDGRVKLTDFGIAHAIDDPRLTTSGTIVGSPAFMAPERVEGREAMPESDLWSLGATLFFAVEGMVAFERPTTAATLHAIMTEVPYLTRGRGPLAAAVLGLLVAKPEARLTAPQARALLATAAGQSPTPAPGSVTMPHPGAQPMTRVAPQPPKRGRRGWWLGAAAVLVVAALAGGFFLGKPVWSPKTDPQMLPTVTYGPDGYLKTALDNYQPCYNAVVQPGIVIGDDNNVECKKSHTLEVYDSADALPVESYSSDDAQVAAYPGLDAISRAAEARCATSFTSSVVPAPQRAGLTYRALVPTEREWNLTPEKSSDSPSREFHCVLARAGNGQIPAQITTKVK